MLFKFPWLIFCWTAPVTLSFTFVNENSKYNISTEKPFLPVKMCAWLFIQNLPSTYWRIGNPSEVLKVGQYVNAKIMEIDTEKKKIELSMKELEEPELDIKANEEPAKEEKIEE